MNKSSKVISIIIPCFNEERTIKEIVERIHGVRLPNDFEIVIIDDCSTDGSEQVINQLLSNQMVNKFKKHTRNLGKGAAIRTGIEISSGSIILIQDADLEYSPKDYPSLLEPILKGSAQVVYGFRDISLISKESSPLHRALANKFLTKLSNLFTGLDLTDMETCYKLFLKQDLRYQILRENRFGFEPEFTALVARQKLKVIELPISYSPRTKSDGKKIGFKDGLRAIWVIVFCAFHKNKAL
jgi:glycosyltransferase involved in cell wall biosynthesis